MEATNLHIGCGKNILKDWINIDILSKKEICKSYGLEEKDVDGTIYQYDIFNLPFEAGSVDKILSESNLEHLSFVEEGKIFKEFNRILKKGGVLEICVPDFEKLVKMWLGAKDDFKDFYTTDEDNHWFGQYERNFTERWGMLTACLFGNQAHLGQFHKNAYTKQKLLNIYNKLEFKNLVLTEEKHLRSQEPLIRIIGEKQ